MSERQTFMDIPVVLVPGMPDDVVAIGKVPSDTREPVAGAVLSGLSTTFRTGPDGNRYRV